MSKQLGDLPNPTESDWSHDQLTAALARPGEIHAGKIEVRVDLLEDLLKGYRAYRLECAANDINDFEGGDEARGYRKTEAVLTAYGFDVPDPSGRVSRALAEEA